MRITAIRETTASLTSTMRNAFIDFSKMTLSVVAVETDVVRDGRRVVGFGFNSNGRYAQGGVLRERLIPRILEAKPGSLRRWQTPETRERVPRRLDRESPGD